MLKPRLVRGFSILGDGMRKWVAFGVLCVTAASRWVLAENRPELGSTLRSEAWACGVLAVVAFALALRRGRPGARSVLGLMAVGGGLLAMPAFGAALDGVAGEALNRTVALCFVPVVVAVICGIVEGRPARLWPGLAGLAGTLLLFPAVTSASAWAYAGLLLPLLAVGGACVACRRVAGGIAWEWSVALMLAGGAMGLVLIEAGRMFTSGVGAQAVSVGAVGLDVVVAGLVVFVVLQVDAMQYTSRYFVVPLVTIVESVVLFRPYFTLRMGVGMALMALGAGALLRKQGTGDGTPGLHLS